ncbi:MAG: GNAT family N-acetyltransferase [Pseudomonadota bacterium]
MDIVHDTRAQRFHTVLDGHEAYLYYTLPEAGVLDVKTTFVPTALRGRRLGADLVQRVATYAREQGLRITATCWFARKVLEEAREQG